MVNDRAIVGEGTPEAGWQAWAGLRDLAACNLDSLVPLDARVVVVAPHPDDEVLAFGGLLAMLAQRHTRIAVVAVTDGDASHPGSVHWPRDRLAQRRHNESLEGLRQLGIPGHTHFRLQLPDGRVEEHAKALGEGLSSLLAAGDMVLSPWEYDGHPDHDATARAVALACRTTGCTHLQSPVWMWHWAAPGDPRVPWRRMRKLVLSMDARRRKTQAISAHASQLAPRDNGALPVLTVPILERLNRACEYLILPELRLAQGV